MDDVMGHPVVGREDWLAARKALLVREKAFTRLRDALAAERRALPWVKLGDDYVFETEAGPRPLAALFGGRSQLLVYHFMFGPDWTEGCASCSLVADHFDGARPHLAARDVELVCASRAPLATLLGFRDRMGWRFPWLSSGGSRFNFDFGVAFTKNEVAAGTAGYNYGTLVATGEDWHGLSAFYRDGAGQVFHTYSTYGRGADLFVGAYNLLDVAPKGRDEDVLPWTMAWVRHHDRYPEALVD
jgi:predicted dithiol-disulfide oxidoreductase (DUF899 family)